ncbi:MAG: Efflux ABC transporter, permease protein [uncultured Thermomicrobiales bacterium]|uniref:Transport permease protein n=1 Tax=uncultured Thermomicrobiales bacterium TaxID=1645740 RepID=A0A6J4V7S1_9BACT|nr:MAG: Efflux ABC transporter, permease protein [uncultured Thermomicrobiales bacterium]
MTGLSRLTRVELQLLLREGSVFFTLAIPLFVLVIFGITSDGSDTRLPAAVVALTVALKALYEVPTSLGTYRERGLLRRLSTTPARPATLLIAQLIVQTILLVVAVALLLGVATAALGIAGPRHLPWSLATFLLGASAMFAIGLFLAAVAPSARMATGVGVLLYFPLAFLGGVTVPRELMPSLLARIGDFTPLGAFRQALHDSWSGAAPQPLHLVVMAAYAAVIGIAAIKFFRWE